MNEMLVAVDIYSASNNAAVLSSNVGAAQFGYETARQGYEAGNSRQDSYELPALTFWGGEEGLVLPTLTQRSDATTGTWFANVQKRLQERSGDSVVQNVLAQSIESAECISEVLEIEIISNLCRTSGMSDLIDLFQAC